MIFRNERVVLSHHTVHTSGRLLFIYDVAGCSATEVRASSHHPTTHPMMSGSCMGGGDPIGESPAIRAESKKSARRLFIGTSRQLKHRPRLGVSVELVWAPFASSSGLLKLRICCFSFTSSGLFSSLRYVIAATWFIRKSAHFLSFHAEDVMLTSDGSWLLDSWDSAC